MLNNDITNNKPRRIYVDGIWDCYHAGHVLHFKHMKYLDNKNNHLIVGIISDEQATSYKRKPIYNENQRCILVESCKYVDEVIENAPLIVTKDFMDLHNIDLVCHGFFNDNDSNNQSEFFKIPIELGKFRKVQYNHGISTTEIIEKIKKEY